MKSLQSKLSYLFFYFCLSHAVHAVKVPDIHVSVTADSSAAAQEQAINKAHLKAYEKLLEISGNSKLPPAPSLETIMDMVVEFSVEHEKTTSTTYSALFTFDFDDTQIISQPPPLLATNAVSEITTPPSISLATSHSPIILYVSYKNHKEWVELKAMLHTISYVKSFSLLSLTTNEAEVNLYFDGSLNQLSAAFHNNGYHLSTQENGVIRLEKADPSHSLEGIVNEYSELN